MKINKDLYIASVASWLPSVVPLRAAVAEGLVDAEHRDLGYESIAVAEGVSGPEMAVRAGRRALERSGLDAGEVGLVLHSSCGYQGHDMWATASYVANETVGASAPGFDLQQRCNAATGSMCLAAGYINTGFTDAVLMTTGDNFAPPWVDRWNIQLNLIFADGGTALVMSNRTGFARIVSLAMGAENTLEAWNRGTAPFGTTPGAELPVMLRDRVAERAAQVGEHSFYETYQAALSATVDQALNDAQVTTQDIARVVIPLIHRGQSPENYEVIGFTEKQSTWDIGRRVGHVGPGDQFLGLEHLVKERSVGRGDLVLVVAAGAGFSYTAAVVEILDVPDW